MTDDETLQYGELLRYADPAKYLLVAGSGQFYSTVCLACIHCEVLSNDPIANNPVLQFMAMFGEHETQQPKTDPILGCNQSQDMAEVERRERYRTFPDLPVAELCSKFKPRSI